MRTTPQRNRAQHPRSLATLWRRRANQARPIVYDGVLYIVTGDNDLDVHDLHLFYSGSITTGGGLVFVGRGDGRITALDWSNGKRFWEFQTDGGVNAPTSTFARRQAISRRVRRRHEPRRQQAVRRGLVILARRHAAIVARDSADPPSRTTTAATIAVPAGRVADLAHGGELFGQHDAARGAPRRRRICSWPKSPSRRRLTRRAYAATQWLRPCCFA